MTHIPFSFSYQSFSVPEVLLTHLSQKNMDLSFSAMNESMKILAAHNAAFVLDVLMGGENLGCKAGDSMFRASLECVKTKGQKAMLAGQSRCVPTSLVTCQAYENALGLIRTSLKTQVPMADHYFIKPTEHMVMSAQVTLVEREDAVVCALFLGTLNRLQPERANTLEHVFEWLHGAMTRATNDVPFMFRKFILFLVANFDLYMPGLSTRERGHILGRLVGMAQAARHEHMGPVGGGAQDIPPRDDREVMVKKPLISIEDLGQFLVMTSRVWAKKVAGEAGSFVDTDPLEDKRHIDDRIMGYVKQFTHSDMPITHLMLRTAELYYVTLRYPCVVGSDDLDPLFILAPDVNTRQYQGFLMLIKNFLFAEELGQLSKVTVEACMVLLQQVGLKLAELSEFTSRRVELQLKWIHLVVTQEMKRLNENDFPYGFERLANRVSRLVAFMIPESVKGSPKEDPDVAERVVEFWAGSGRYRKEPPNPHRIFVVRVSLLVLLIVVCW